jgi:hypothetical protein
MSAIGKSGRDSDIANRSKLTLKRVKPVGDNVSTSGFIGAASSN